MKTLKEMCEKVQWAGDSLATWCVTRDVSADDDSLGTWVVLLLRVYADPAELDCGPIVIGRGAERADAIADAARDAETKLRKACVLWNVKPEELARAA